MVRFINPLLVNNVIDANIVDHIAAEIWEPIRQILELHDTGEIQLIIPHSVRTEILRQTTPAAIRAAAQDFIFTIDVGLTPEERIDRDRLLQRARGNAKLKNIAADLSHVAEAAKYGGYFITMDERLLKRAAVISEVFDNIEVVTPNRFVEKVAEAKKMMTNIAYKRRNKHIEDVDSIFQKLDTGEDINKIRGKIADLIFNYLQLMEKPLGYWEKMYFANSIVALAWNINSSHQPPPDSWLRLCLVNLEQAFVPREQRNENYTPRNSQIDSITFERLIEAIKEIRTRLQN